MKLPLFAFCLLGACYSVYAFLHKNKNFVATETKSPLLVVVLMVKNEAPVICQTLQPFVTAGVQHYLIFDTGSHDGTQQVVAQFFDERQVQHGQVLEEAFIDYATSRNRALERAEQLFPHATFLLMLDAEWYINDVPALLQFCKENKKDAHEAFLIRIKTNELDFYLPRLVRPQAHLRFQGDIHEHLVIEQAKKIPAHVYFEVLASQHGQDATRQRLSNDLAKLLKRHLQDPQDVRTIFFLAQTYVSLGELQKAYEYFTLCVAKSEINPTTSYWIVDQAYQASLNAGIIAQELSRTHSAFTWDLAQRHYLQAFTFTPCRAEPLVAIAQYYWDVGNMHLCFVFARRAADLPFPEHATGLVARDVYDFKRYDLLGACAGNIGNYEVSEWALQKAIAAAPQKEYLQKNLSYVQKRKQQAVEQKSALNHYEL